MGGWVNGADGSVGWVGRSAGWVGVSVGWVGGSTRWLGWCGCVGWWVGQLGGRISHFQHAVMLYFVLYLLALSFLLHKTFV